MFDIFGEVEKRMVFNRTFWRGFVFGLGIFILFNCISYLSYLVEERVPRIVFSGGSRGYDFGFPWDWDGDSNIVANVIVCVLFGLAIGIVTRFFDRVPKIGPMK